MAEPVAPTPDEIIAPIKAELDTAMQTFYDSRTALDTLHYKRLGLDYIAECMKGDDMLVSKERLLAAVTLLQAYHDALPA